jgi:selenocysteine lyase/cysteine desulfurase
VACANVSSLWREQEDSLTPQLLDALSGRDNVRLLGPASLDAVSGHRCPTIAFLTLEQEPAVVASSLVQRGVQTSASDYYAVRVLDGLGVDVDRGVVRLSFVHYTGQTDIDRALNALDDVLG